MLKHLSFVLLVSVAACANQEAVPVRVLPMATPGVVQVIVQPSASGQFNASARGVIGLDVRSHYILECDGRGVKGVVCVMPPEANHQGRISAGKSAKRALSPIEVGTSTTKTGGQP